MPILAYILVAFAAYLLGSIPTGFVVAKANGVDIRTVGSKNMGATNVFRVLGKGPGIFVLVMDGLKGYAACVFFPPLIFNWLAPHVSGLAVSFQNEPVELQMRLNVAAGIFAVLGHNFTCWLQFKGGKGIATSAGVYFALAPLAVSIALGTWIILFAATRYVSVASIAAAVALPTAVWLTQPNWLLRIVTVALGALAIFRHRKNIQRLINGTENRVQFGKKEASP